MSYPPYIFNCNHFFQSNLMNWSNFAPLHKCTAWVRAPRARAFDREKLFSLSLTHTLSSLSLSLSLSLSHTHSFSPSYSLNFFGIYSYSKTMARWSVVVPLHVARAGHVHTHAHTHTHTNTVRNLLRISRGSFFRA